MQSDKCGPLCNKILKIFIMFSLKVGFKSYKKQVARVPWIFKDFPPNLSDFVKF